MKKLIVLVCILVALAGCKTLSESERNAQIKASEHAMSAK